MHSSIVGTAVVLLALLSPSSSSSSSSAATTSTPHPNEHHEQQAHRQLELGDYDSTLNDKLFDHSIISLPDIITEQRIIFSTATLRIEDISCQNINVGDIHIETVEREISPTDGQVVYNIPNILDNISMDCSLQYGYKAIGGIIQGSGSITMSVMIDYIDTITQFVAESVNVPPNSYTTPTCSSNVELDLTVDAVDGNLDVIVPIINGLLESVMEGVACDRFNTLGSMLIIQLQNQFSDLIMNRYLTNTTVLTEFTTQNPLSAEEEALSATTNTDNNEDWVGFLNVANLPTTGNTPSLGWWDDMRTMLNQILWSDVRTETETTTTTTTDNAFSSSSSSSSQDLGINVLLRNYLLRESDGGIGINFQSSDDDDEECTTGNSLQGLFGTGSGTGTGGGLILYEDVVGGLLATKLEVTSIDLWGLDTLRQIDPLQGLGLYTATTTVEWEQLVFKAEIELTIGPDNDNNDPNSILQVIDDGYNSMKDAIDAATITETFSIRLQANEISIILTALLAMNADILQSTNIISILFQNAIGSNTGNTGNNNANDNNEGKKGSDCPSSSSSSFLSSPLLKCTLQSLVSKIDVTQLLVTIGSIDDLPRYNGIESIGIHHLLTQSANIVYSLFRPSLVQVIPLISQTTILNQLQTSIDNLLLGIMNNDNEENENDGEDDECPILIEQDNSLIANTIQDPLSAQEALDTTMTTTNMDTTTELVDFTNITLFAEINNYLNNGPEGSTLMDGLQINDVIRSLLLNNDDDEQGGGPLTLEWSGQTVHIYGLDTIQELNLLDAIAPQTLMNTITLDELKIEFMLGGSSSGNGNDTAERRSRSRSLQEEDNNDSDSDDEAISISVTLTNVEISLAVFLAIDLDRMQKDIVLGSLMETKDILPCLASRLFDASIPQLTVDVDSITDFSISGLPSQDMDRALLDFTTILQTQYSDMLTSAIPLLFNDVLRNRLNNALTDYMQSSQSTENDACPTRTATSDSSTFDYRDWFLSDTQQARALGGTGTAPYGNLFSSIWDLITNVLLDVDETTGLATLLNDALLGTFLSNSSTTTGILELDSHLIDVNSTLSVGGLNAGFELKLDHIRLEQLDSIGKPLALLNPMAQSPHDLSNTATIGAGGRPVRLSFRFLIALAKLGDGASQMRNEVDINLDLDSVNVLFQIMAQFLESSIYQYPLGDLLELPCWLAAMPRPQLDERGIREMGTEPSAALIDFVTQSREVTIGVDCVTCSGSKFQELSEILGNSQEATTAAHDLVELVSENILKGEFLQFYLDRFINDAGQNCPHHPDYFNVSLENGTVYEPFEPMEMYDNSSFLRGLGYVVICSLLVLVGFFRFTHYSVQRQHQKWLGTLSTQEELSLVRQQHVEEQIESNINDGTGYSMFSHPEIPLLLRMSMPVIIVGNLALFMSGHLSKGATVIIQAQLGGEQFRVEDFFTFSMLRTSVEIWKAGGKQLAAMIWISSVIWPYTKQLISLVAWFLPPSKLSVARRGSIFIWLDRLAKWSIVDVFVLVITVAAFKVQIASPNYLKYLPDDFYSADLFIVPLWGLYANLLAQLISQVSSHFIIHYHRRIVHVATTGFYDTIEGGDGTPTSHYDRPNQSKTLEAKSTKDATSVDDISSDADTGGLDSEKSSNFNKEQNNNRVMLEEEENDMGTIVVAGNQFVVLSDGQSSELCMHRFSIPSRALSDSSTKVIPRPAVNGCLIVLGAFVGLFVTLGCILSSFSFDLVGLLGVAVQIGQQNEDAYITHNIFTLMKTLIDQARLVDVGRYYIGMGTLSLLVVVTVLLVPILQSVVLLYQWFSPMSLKKRMRLTFVNETLQAWQYSEVYLLSIFVASWQLGPISEYMVNSNCGRLEETFSQLVYFGILEPDDGQCFRVNTGLEVGYFILLGASVFLYLLNLFITRAASHYLMDEVTRSKAVLPSPSCHPPVTEVRTGGGVSDDGDGEETRNDVKPADVFFTDMFGCALFIEEDDEEEDD